jgi:hypothetical protein
MKRRPPAAKPEGEEWAEQHLSTAENLRRMFPNATHEPQALVEETERAIERGDGLLQRIIDEKRMGLSDDDILHGKDGKHGILGSLDPHNEASGRFAKRLLDLGNAIVKADHPGGPTDAERTEIQRSALLANWAGLHDLAPGDDREAHRKRHELKQLFKDEFGISSPDTPNAHAHYTGQGAFGSVIDRELKGALDPKFSFQSPSARGKNLVEVARSQLGVREATGHNDGLPNRRYMEGRAPEPWCSDFFKWCMKQVDPKMAEKYGSPSCTEAMNKFGRAGNLRRPSSYVPRPGDQIFFGSRDGSDRGLAHHTGMVVKVQNGRVYTIEGNSANMVAERCYPIGSKKIIAYGDVQNG